MLCRDYELKPIVDREKLCRVLCFPRVEEECCFSRLSQIRGLGVVEIYDFGKVVLEDGVRVVGKGHAAVVVLARYNNELVAVKIRRLDSKRDSLEREAELLILAKASSFVPKVYAYSRDFIVREFIDGPTLKEFMATVSLQQLRNGFAKLIEAAYSLDRIGIDINEISRPDTQVIFECGDPLKPRFIDLESARVSHNASNVTRIVASIMRYRKAYPLFLDLSDEEIEYVLMLAKKYKIAEADSRKDIVERIILTLLR
ncbi:MAG: hypothetical protein JHC33_01810 [Ignisphaera sp.]|nr:hypothetical protein [Ignisphaera sp.]